MYSKLKIMTCSVLCLLVLFFVCLRAFSPSSLSDEQIISQVMSYDMTDAVKRCQKDYGYADSDMIMIEQELKRYLILCMLKENIDDNINMYSSDVDNLWHSFILFTKKYAAFCNKIAHRFIHHTPRVNDILSQEELLEARKDFRSFVEKYEKTFHEEVHPIWLLDRCA